MLVAVVVLVVVMTMIVMVVSDSCGDFGPTTISFFLKLFLKNACKK